MNWYKARVLLLLACMVLVCASALSAQQKVQSNFILSPKGLNLFFKYEDEYLAKARRRVGPLCLDSRGPFVIRSRKLRKSRRMRRSG